MTRASIGESATKLRLQNAMLELLGERSFSEISVAAILERATVSRGTFYFYFASKQAVLAELVTIAVGRATSDAGPWIDGGVDPSGELLAGITAGSRTWQENAVVLRAIVENWRSDDGLRDIWLAQMAGLSAATVARIRADPEIVARLADANIEAVVDSLTWLGERLYYLSAIGQAPFDDETVLVRTLHRVWMSVLYGLPRTFGGDPKDSAGT